jgi:hypothetical protein
MTVCNLGAPSAQIVDMFRPITRMPVSLLAKSVTSVKSTTSSNFTEADEYHAESHPPRAAR